VVTGDPATRIAELARERRFHLIVMPTHAGAFRRTLLGSTTAKVLNDADCPVLTTRHAETISPKPLGHAEWVCAVSLKPDSERVLRYASKAARSARANLALIHVVPQTEASSDLQFDLEERVQSEEKQAARRYIDEMQQKIGSKAGVRIVVGPVKEALTEAACRLHADALIIGRSPHVGVRLRDLTYAVVRDAPCPVLSV